MIKSIKTPFWLSITAQHIHVQMVCILYLSEIKSMNLKKMRTFDSCPMCIILMYKGSIIQERYHPTSYYLVIFLIAPLSNDNIKHNYLICTFNFILINSTNHHFESLCCLNIIIFKMNCFLYCSIYLFFICILAVL